MLEPINGKALIVHVYHQVIEANVFSNVYVATDDENITNVLDKEGVPYIFTSKEHQSGTDRIIEAVSKMQEPFDFVVNVQGDEALISSTQLQPLKDYLVDHPSSQVVSLMTENNSSSDFNDPNVVKVACSDLMQALYFSRSPIPHNRDGNFERFHQHLGVYAFKRDILDKIKTMQISTLERSEKLEQLRWMENGISIHMVNVSGPLIGVDVEEDIAKVKELLQQN